MEISEKLKLLYRHWQDDTKKPNNCKVTTDTTLLNIEKFASERMNIWEKKNASEKAPFTTDEIMNKYRFCNIYRELDYQTIYFHNLLLPYRDNFELWLLNMLFCRFICSPQTIEKVGLLSFNYEHNKDVYTKLVNLPSPKYGTAYVFPVSLILKSEFDTRAKFFCYYLPKISKACAIKITSFKKQSVYSALAEVTEIFKFNFRFHWTEILIDVAYQYPEYIDLFKLFPIGPGSKPTMVQIHSHENTENTCLELTKLSLQKFPYLTYNNQKVYLSAENWEGIGCEFRKYTNLKQGKGRRRVYRHILI